MAFCLLFLAIFVMAGKDEVPPWLASVVQKEIDVIDGNSEATVLSLDVTLFHDGDFVEEHVKEVYRIEKTGGLEYGNLVILSRKKSSVKRIKGWRLDGQGNLVETLNKDNIKERAYNASFVDDAKQVFARFQNVSVGDIVAFEYVHRQHMWFLDMMFPMGAPIDIHLMTVTIRGDVDTAILNDPEQSVHQEGQTFSVSRRPMTTMEALDPPLTDRIPVLALSFDPVHNASWAAFSRHYWSMAHHAARLSETSKQSLGFLWSIPEESAFIEAALTHVTKSVNYIDIEFGKGAFIPRTADFVNEKKYGDCKDMAFYAAAILGERGVSAFPVLARTRSRGRVYSEFPCDQFNHVILAVALDSSSASLENAVFNGKSYLLADLTDRFTPHDMIGAHLEETRILPVMAEGAEIWTVPQSRPEQNTIVFDVEISVHANRTMDVTATEKRFGHHAVKEMALLEHASQDRIHEIYHEWIQRLVPGAQVTHIRVDQGSHHTETHLGFSAANVGLEVEDGILFVPNFVDRRPAYVKKRKRMSDIEHGFRFKNSLHVTVRCDPEVEIKEIPKSGESAGDLFSYTYTCSREGGAVVIHRQAIQPVACIPRERYEEYRSAYRAYLKQVKSPLILGFP